jgi:hypothetical protein
VKGQTNVAASIRQRLFNQSKSEKRPFNEFLQYYAMERFLYRLSRSGYVEQFILKGAMMLRAWRSPEFRPTMDIDLLGKSSHEVAYILKQIKEILAVNVETDGLIFNPASVRSDPIDEDANYHGIRIRFQGLLDSARITLQIDIGFGDVVYPKPEMLDLPTILDSPVPRLFCYSRESAIAEKFEAMIKLGVLNSRMKDFYDIWLLSQTFNFEAKTLAEAIRLTFHQRETSFPESIAAFSEDFVRAKQIQWKAYRDRIKQNQIPTSFSEIAASIEGFLAPLVHALSTDDHWPESWEAPGPWLQQGPRISE